ncbi:MAG: SusC/RagA family TonB-linked outer membrane protein [Bacteroidetes bacterium]|nr:SusC/RagA family TonB-linked outer membrane protein [Bacteroidota bacterium]
MRMTAALLLIACLQVSARGLAQKITLSEQNVPLKKIFKAIKQQTGYVFFYKSELLAASHPVTIRVKDEDLESVLEKCFRNQPLSYNIVNKTIVVGPRRESSLEQENPVLDTVPSALVVTGRITDEADKPVAGANIVLSGSGEPRGVVSDKSGEFKISAKPGATLTISYVGYASQQIRVKGTGPYSVRIIPGTKDPLANMVVTGYQLINKDNFTGNAVQVSGEELKKVNPQNVLQSIQVFDPSFNVAQSNLAGSNPNALPNVYVRGSTAIPTGSGAVLSRNDLTSSVNLPTFILDGYQVDIQKVYDLDVNRIQSITLLKDAAATAVYGSRAANGVLVITTKAPKEGKLQLYYNYEFRTNAPDLTDYHVLDASQKLQYEKLAGVYNPVGSLVADEQEKIYYSKYKSVVSGINTYWLSQPLRTSFGQKHSLYAEGGGSSVRYGLNLLYQTDPGVMKGSSRDRYSLGMDLSYNPGKSFIFRNSLSVTQVNATESPYGNFYDYVRMNPYYPKTDSSGKIIQNVDNWLIDTHRDREDQYVTDYVLNPLFNATLHSFNRNRYVELIDAFSSEWNIARGFRLRSVFSYTKRKYTGDNFVSPYANSFFFYSGNQLTQRGSYTYSASDENTFDGTLTLTYNRNIGSHFFNVALATNAHTYNIDAKSFTAVGFTNDRFTNIGFANGYLQGSAPYGDFSKQRLFGSLLSLNYSWKNKYLLDASARADGSSEFGSDHRVAPFWAVGLGWNINREDFLAGSKAISLLRLKGSMGHIGSVSFPPYQAETIYHYYSSNWYSTGIGATVNTYGNEQLQWQQTSTYDAGLDLGLFNDRIMLTPRYYYKLTHGMLADIRVPSSTGFNSYKDNLGDMANRGYELGLRYTILHSRNLVVNVFTNLVRNTNKIVKISNALKSYNDKADQLQQGDSLKATPLLRYQEGQSVNTIYAVRSLGIDPENGKEIYLKKDGKTRTYTWDVHDIVPVADYTPKLTGSFGSTVTYKQFQLNLVFFTHLGGKDYNQTLVDRVENADPRYNVDSRVLTDRWKAPGDHAKFKNITDLGTSRVSSRFVQEDNTLDLTSVYFSYDLKSSVYSKLAMKSCRLAFTTNNVFHWSSLKIERGIDYPFARSFTLSLQTSF